MNNTHGNIILLARLLNLDTKDNINYNELSLTVNKTKDMTKYLKEFKEFLINPTDDFKFLTNFQKLIIKLPEIDMGAGWGEKLGQLFVGAFSFAWEIGRASCRERV